VVSRGGVFSFLFLSLSLPFLGACSNSSDNDDGDPGDLRTGSIGPVPIRGLAYTSGDQTGTTNESGEFSYRVGENIEFRLGDTVLGSARGASGLSLFDLQGAQRLVNVEEIVDTLDNSSSPYTASVNLVRLLYSLDADQDWSNGITIDTSVADAFASISLSFGLLPRRFAYSSDLQTVLESAGRSLTPLVSSLGHQYERAGINLRENGIELGRRTEAELIEGTEGSSGRLEFTYDTLGNLVRQESFDAQGRLLASSVFLFDAQGLETRRSIDSDGDGIVEWESRVQRNTAGDVVVAIDSSGVGLTNESRTETTYNELGQDVETATTRDIIGFPTFVVTREFAENGLPSRIEVNSGGDAEADVIMTYVYDSSNRLVGDTFVGEGIDPHDFRDSSPPNLGVGAIDLFDAQDPYWGEFVGLIGDSDDSFRSRRTDYIRDSEGRVVARNTDRNNDGVADQIAQLNFEDGRPVSWFYDAQGDGVFESSALYTYSELDQAVLTTVQERIAVENGVSVSTRIIETDDDGDRISIRTTSNALGPGASEVFFTYDSAGRLTETGFDIGPDGSLDSRELTTWEPSYRLDDSRISSFSWQ